MSVYKAFYSVLSGIGKRKHEWTRGDCTITAKSAEEAERQAISWVWDNIRETHTRVDPRVIITQLMKL